LVTVVLGGLIVLMLHSASAGQQSFFAYTWVWLLLFGGFGQVLAFQHERRNGGDTGSDAVVLRTMTWLPASLWSGFFWLASLIALVVGAGILLHLVDLHQ
jgi:divalent metal cation (Fe/Co/Zn/Cd) transporter